MKYKSIKFIGSEQYFPPENINLIEPNLYTNNHWLVPFNLFFYFYETTWSTGIKQGRNSSGIVSFHCVWQVWVRSKMATSDEHNIIKGSMGHSRKHGAGER